MQHSLLIEESIVNWLQYKLNNIELVEGLKAQMKTSSSMYAMLCVEMMALTHSLTFHMPSLFTQKLYKIQNKFK